jgi:hypothetical protein
MGEYLKGGLVKYLKSMDNLRKKIEGWTKVENSVILARVSVDFYLCKGGYA